MSINHSNGLHSQSKMDTHVHHVTHDQPRSIEVGSAWRVRAPRWDAHPTSISDAEGGNQPPFWTRDPQTTSIFGHRRAKQPLLGTGIGGFAGAFFFGGRGERVGQPLARRKSGRWGSTLESGKVKLSRLGWACRACSNLVFRICNRQYMANSTWQCTIQVGCACL